MNAGGNLPGALAAWTSVLGAEHVHGDAARIARVERATLPTSSSVPAVLRPADRGQVQACVRVAQEFGVPVYPVSAGKNWGYGSRVPWQDGCAVLDLGRMDKVVAVDAELGTLTVQPGVTFRQAHAFLRARQAPFFLAATGGSPESSLIGNAVERGDGLGPCADVFAHVCNLEVVLPNGSCIRTGFGRAPGAAVAGLARYGVGPFVDGLFTQSSLGIVTEMTFWLAPLPEWLVGSFAVLQEEQKLPALVDAVRTLLLEGTLQGPAYFWDRGKALSVMGAYPFHRTGGKTPLPPDVEAALAEEAHLGAWMLTHAFYGPDLGLVGARRERARAVLQGVVDGLEFSAPEHRPVDSLLVGKPVVDNVRMVYWRKPGGMPEQPDPDRDGCGFLWCSGCVPLRGDAVLRGTTVAREVLQLHGLDSNLAVIAVEPRSAYLLAALVYDRDVDGEDERALACQRALHREWWAEGIAPFRLGISSADAMPPMSAEDRAFLLRLKDSLDPRNLLAPGRYAPR